jgi:putative tryptophan/tyrosine transport system substrate-binding protein
MRRRDFITVMVGAMVLPDAARAQQASLPVIGFMSARTPEDSASVLQAFHKGLKEEGGFADGENVRIEYRWGRGNYAAMPALASELVERHVWSRSAAMPPRARRKPRHRRSRSFLP